MPINQFDLSNRGLLESIQGNILKGHGRHHTANLFITGKTGNQEKMKQWLRHLVEGENPLIKSCYSQLRSNALWKDKEIDSGIFGCIHISAAGYRYLLNLGEGDMNSVFDTSFNNGMRKADLQDPSPDKWEKGLNDDAHFLLIIADSNAGNVSRKVLDIRREIQDFADVVFTEIGDAIFNSEKAGIEHFGYVDGISQPLFFEDEIEKYQADNSIPPNLQSTFNPSAEIDLVLIKDPFSELSTAMGSFLVFRKLEQNVKGFKKAEKELANKLGLTGEDEERAGAMLVGRFEDGTPVQISSEPGIINSAVINNFDYDKTNEGKLDESKCPYHAHIRKSNPRSDIGGSKDHIMARRGIPYGTRSDNPNDGQIDNKPEGGVGLLFMSYQKSIENQFEFIQKLWVNNDTFPNFNPKDKDGLDPIIGQGNSRALGAYPTIWGDPKSIKQCSFDLFVTMKGGGYFFAPSINFLKNL
ncbi:MAG: Dyp-type peroxidase [Arcicella sp.]|jgi:Dyp-type peroxidase family|nr:Dyp-type peroxidase [Arcicella sp.]